MPGGESRAGRGLTAPRGAPRQRHLPGSPASRRSALVRTLLETQVAVYLSVCLLQEPKHVFKIQKLKFKFNRNSAFDRCFFPNSGMRKRLTDKDAASCRVSAGGAPRSPWARKQERADTARSGGGAREPLWNLHY